jgi:hypothetical protein
VAGLLLATGCGSKTSAQDDKPEAKTAAEAPAAKKPASLNLPALRIRPNYLVGHAVFEDGRPIPEFEVGYEGGFGGGSSGTGHNGQFEVKNQDPASIIVRNAEAKIHVPYRGKTYVLPLAPLDNKTDNQSSEEWRADIQQGASRDFIFRLTGTQPGHKPVDPASVADTDTYDVKHGFWGQTASVYLDPAVARVGNTVEITLVPDGPLIDGSAGKTITRALQLKEPGNNYYLYDLPLGTYAVTARLLSPGGAPKPLHLKEQVIDDPQSSGDTPQSSVKLTWTFDTHLQGINSPSLTVLE